MKSGENLPSSLGSATAAGSAGSRGARTCLRSRSQPVGVRSGFRRQASPVNPKSHFTSTYGFLRNGRLAARAQRAAAKAEEEVGSLGPRERSRSQGAGVAPGRSCRAVDLPEETRRTGLGSLRPRGARSGWVCDGRGDDRGPAGGPAPAPTPGVRSPPSECPLC